MSYSCGKQENGAPCGKQCQIRAIKQDKPEKGRKAGDTYYWCPSHNFVKYTDQDDSKIYGGMAGQKRSAPEPDATSAAAPQASVSPRLRPEVQPTVVIDHPFQSLTALTTALPEYRGTDFADPVKYRVVLRFEALQRGAPPPALEAWPNWAHSS